VGKLNTRVLLSYEPDPIPIADEKQAKQLVRAIKDMVATLAWDEDDEAHVVLREHLNKMSRDLRGGASSDDEATPKKTSTRAGRRGRPPLSDEEKARRRAERGGKKPPTVKSGVPSDDDQGPSKRRGRPPGSKNKKTVQKDNMSKELDPKGDADKSNGSSNPSGPGDADDEVPSVSEMALADATGDGGDAGEPQEDDRF